jgi:DNA-binding transcriptional ArsR family regulator
MQTARNGREPPPRPVFSLVNGMALMLDHNHGKEHWALRDEDLAGFYPPRALNGGDVDISAVAALLADHARGAMLLALTGGTSMTAGKLAATARITPATASSHLKKLTDAGFLKVEPRGRERRYRLSGPRVAALIEMLEEFAPSREITSLTDHNHAKAVRAGRACYDHVGGRLGTEIMTRMLKDGSLTRFAPPIDAATPRHEVDYALSREGREFLRRIGASMPAHDVTVRYCTDWSEYRPHLSGALGRSMFRAFVEKQWVELARDGRALKFRPLGIDGFAREFGIQLA